MSVSPASATAPVERKSPQEESRDFASLQIDHLQRIIRDSAERLQFINDTVYTAENAARFKEILGGGIWYAQDYCKALQKIAQQAAERFKWFVAKNLVMLGYASPKHFSRIKNTDQKPVTDETPCAFCVREGIEPSEALASLGRELGLLDCGSVYYLATYRALQDYIGREKFNRLFQENHLMLGANRRDTTVSCLFTVVEIGSLGELRPGDRCHFSNMKEYTIKHFFGEARGYNVMRDNQGTFLGLGLSHEGASKEEIEQALFDGFNSTPLGENCVSKAQMQKIYKYVSPTFSLDLQSFAKTTVTREEFQRAEILSKNKPVDGKLCSTPMRPNLARIEQLKEASLEQVGKIFQEFLKTTFVEQ